MILTPDMATLKNQLKLFQCTIRYIRTGHAMYQRGFITDPRGIQIGRAVIHDGELSHIKWYKGSSHVVNNGMPIRLYWLQKYDVMVTDREWCLEVIPAAMRARAQFMNIVRENRRKRVEEDLRTIKKIRKRRALQERELSDFILPPTRIIHSESLPPLPPVYVPALQ